MAFTVRNSGDVIRAADIRELQDAWQGVSGGGNRMQLIQVDDATNYVLHIKPQDTTNGRALLIEKQDGTDVLDVKQATIAAWTNVLYVTSAGLMFINDSSNANMTQGLTISQGGGDDEVLALKSSDVAHGVTAHAETDTFLYVRKDHASGGGAHIVGLRKTAATDGCAADLTGVFSGTPSTVKSTTGWGLVEVKAYQASGTALTNTTANGNLFAIVTQMSGSNVRVLFVDAEGDIHCDAGGGAGTAGVITGTAPNEQIAGYNTYDAFEDAELVRALDIERNGGGLIRDEFDRFLQYNRGDLQRLKIATFNPDSTFINYTALVRLHSGAIWQIYRKYREMEERVSSLLGELTQLRALLPANG